MIQLTHHNRIKNRVRRNDYVTARLQFRLTSGSMVAPTGFHSVNSHTNLAGTRDARLRPRALNFSRANSFSERTFLLQTSLRANLVKKKKT